MQFFRTLIAVCSGPSAFPGLMNRNPFRAVFHLLLLCVLLALVISAFRIADFREPERVRPTVAYRLINYEKNRELLQEIPHLPFLDLAVIFYSLLTDTPVGHATVLIRNSHLELWGKNTSWLYEAAKENTEKLLPKRLVSMEDMIYELSEGKQEAEYAGVPMYVLTNSRKSFGAACLLYDGVLGECFRRLEESYYLIPSSVHEVILIPASAVGDSRELCALVQEMNRTQVRSTEVLSDTVYLYSEETRRLEMIDF